MYTFNNQVYDEVISLGDHCASAIALQHAGLRTASYPFDWVTNGPQMDSDTLILWFLELLEMHYVKGHSCAEIAHAFAPEVDMRSWYLLDRIDPNGKGVLFAHEHEDVPTVRAKYERRFQRLFQVLATQNVLFLLVSRQFPKQSTLDCLHAVLTTHVPKFQVLLVHGQQPKGINFNEAWSWLVVHHIYYDSDQLHSCPYDQGVFRPQFCEYVKTHIQTTAQPLPATEPPQQHPLDYTHFVL